jgi:tetratricopeptide (TPR) repeat protein
MMNNFTASALAQRVLSKPSIATFLLILGAMIANISHATVNRIPTPIQEVQTTSMRSFHETTELAESLWSNLTTRFVSLYEQGKYQAAYDAASRAYTIAENSFGLDDVNTADSLLKLGIINQTLGNLIVAEDNLLGALVILEEKLSPDHPDVAVVLSNLGNVYFELKRPKDSEKYHRLALKIRENALGALNPSVAQSNYNLAVLYENQGDYDKAAALYQKAINLWSQTLGPTHPYVGNALSNLSNTYIAQSKFSKAAQVIQRTIDFKKSVFGLDHQEVAQSLINLGALYVEQGQYSPAGTAYAEALQIAKHLLNSSDPQLALLMYSLANVYHSQASSHIDATNNNISKQASTQYEDIKLLQQAVPLYQQAAQILDSEDSNKPALDVILSELALVYKAMGNTDMAMATESRITH